MTLLVATPATPVVKDEHDTASISRRCSHAPVGTTAWRQGWDGTVAQGLHKQHSRRRWLRQQPKGGWDWSIILQSHSRMLITLKRRLNADHRSCDLSMHHVAAANRLAVAYVGYAAADLYDDSVNSAQTSACADFSYYT